MGGWGWSMSLACELLTLLLTCGNPQTCFLLLTADSGYSLYLLLFKVVATA